MELPLRDPPQGTSSPETAAKQAHSDSAERPCRPEKPVQPVVTSRQIGPLSSKQKGELALRDIYDSFNLLTIAAYSGFAMAVNSHSAYGPGFEDWGKLSGYSLLEDAQGEFLSTYVISSLAHEDPRYHRMPQATIKCRVLHALAHTWV